MTEPQAFTEPQPLTEPPALFRQEVVLARSRRPLGAVSFGLPAAHFVAGAVLCVIVVLLAVFAVTASYARKETVVGYLTSQGGIVHVFPTFSGGTLLALNVRQDDNVRAGDVLALVSAQQPLEGGGHLGDVLHDELAQRYVELTAQLRRASKRFDLQRSASENTLTSLTAEIASAQHAQTLRTQYLNLLNTRTAALQRLRSGGNIAEMQWLDHLQDALQAEARITDSASQLVRLRRQYASESARLAELPELAASALAELRLRQSEIDLQQAEIRSKGRVEIRAPLAGAIADVKASVGFRTRADVPIVTIRPHGTALEARLVIPPRAIGFVTPGLQLRLMYDAFPYQHFGSHAAVVVSIADDLVYTGEYLGPVNLRAPAYLARAQLRKQTVTTAEGQIRLRQGMSLRADILLEERSLFEWLLYPLRSLSHRS